MAEVIGTVPAGRANGQGRWNHHAAAGFPVEVVDFRACRCCAPHWRSISRTVERTASPPLLFVCGRGPTALTFLGPQQESGSGPTRQGAFRVSPRKAEKYGVFSASFTPAVQRSSTPPSFPSAIRCYDGASANDFRGPGAFGCGSRSSDGPRQTCCRFVLRRNPRSAGFSVKAWRWRTRSWLKECRCINYRAAKGQRLRTRAPRVAAGQRYACRQLQCFRGWRAAKSHPATFPNDSRPIRAIGAARWEAPMLQAVEWPRIPIVFAG